MYLAHDQTIVVWFEIDRIFRSEGTTDNPPATTETPTTMRTTKTTITTVPTGGCCGPKSFTDAR